jgi:hypothetical protein
MLFTDQFDKLVRQLLRMASKKKSHGRVAQATASYRKLLSICTPQHDDAFLVREVDSR